MKVYVELSSNGQQRERAMTCMECRQVQTWNWSGVCWNCHPLRGLPDEQGRQRPDHE